MKPTNNSTDHSNVRGETGFNPANKGTGTGVTDTYGADLSPEALNRERGIEGETQSDPVKCNG